MKLRNFGFVLGSFTAVVFAVACSSSSGDDSSATGGDAATGSDTSTTTDTGTGSETSTGSCLPLADGTYAVAYSGPDGGAGVCPPNDTTVTLPQPVVDAGDVDSGPNPCTTTTDSTTCTTTTTCNSTSNGYTTASTQTLTVAADGNSATGTSTSTTTQSDGGVLSSCTGVTFTYTKQ